jgi:LuxR family maltose regulon positive regulatory protein
MRGDAHDKFIEDDFLNSSRAVAPCASISRLNQMLANEDRLREPLSESESILRYLPTKLPVPEIANEVYLSVNTLKKHMRDLYGMLGAHRRGQAVERARALGLLAPSSVRIASRSR